MHRGWSLLWRLLAGLLASALCGCADTNAVRTTSWRERFHPFRGPVGSDVVMMEMALLERPAGDPFLNKDLWLAIDEQAVSLDQKALLEQNGFRVGQIGGMVPAGLQTLLTSKQSCMNPRRLLVHAGNPTSLALGPLIPMCRFRLRQDEQSRVVSVEHAECVLEITPSLTEDKKTRLHFTPQIRHGQAQLSPGVAADRSGWVLQEKQPTESYASLSWDVMLTANQYVVVGAFADRCESLGYQCFLPDEAMAVQRLLVIRTARTIAGAESGSLESAADDERADSVPPLALQAAWSTARGKGD